MSFSLNINIFFIGCIAPIHLIHPRIEPHLKCLLEPQVGNIDEVWSPPKLWIPPKTYAMEMGGDLSVVIITFKENYSVNEIAWWKKLTMRIEDRFRLEGHRRFNLNPGYASAYGMYLASHKGSLIRKHIGNNIWIEKQLYYKDRQFYPLPNTFSEYSSHENLTRFSSLLNRRLIDLNKKELLVNPIHFQSEHFV